MSDNIRHTGEIMRIEALRKLADKEELDYQFLISALKNYSRPRDKISAWLKTGDLIRVKKGLYVFGKEVSQSPFSHEVLANLIYGPSAISLTYALSLHGLIPERVVEITSITSKRKKRFDTPVGRFSYYYLNVNRYSVGIEIQKTASGQSFLIASKEKALCDLIYIVEKKRQFKYVEEIKKYLIYELRIEEVRLKEFSVSKLLEINKNYGSKKLELLVELIKEVKKKDA